MMKPASLLCNARIATLDAIRPEAEALLVADGRIAFAGARREAEQLAARLPGVQRIDLGGRCVVPGLFDLHAHLDREGLKLSHPPMAGMQSRRDVLERISKLAAASTAGEWIVTMPIGEPPFYFFPDTAAELAFYPTRDELDEAAPRNPVYIRPILGFWRWAPRRETLVSAANSAALQAVGLDEGVSPPSDSVVIERDRAGRMTGRFLETTTASILELLYFSRAVAFRPEDRVAGLARSQAIANRFGITSTLEGHGVETAVLEAYKALRADRSLTVRAELCFSPSWDALGEFELPEFLDRWAGWLSGPGVGDERLRLRGMFVNPLRAGDDRIRARCGCYTGFAGYNFDSALPEQRTPELLAELARRGVRAVGLSPRLFALYRETHSRHPISGQGWMVQHCGSLSAADIDTAKSIGIGISVLPVESIYKQASIARGDPALRHNWMPLRRLIDRGVRFSLASDNIPPSIFFAIWVCLARRDYLGEVLEDPDSPITRLEALKAATLWSAEMLGCADRRGSLAPGKDADLAVLSEHYFTCPVDSIRDITAHATMLGGEWVHVAPEAAAAIRAPGQMKEQRA